MNAKTLEAITKHGQNLLAIFPEAIERDPVALCKKLRRIETLASRNAVNYCNGAIDTDSYDTERDAVFNRLCKVLGLADDDNPKRDWLKINGDPRGYALKIRDHVMRDHKLTLHTDWGGYGILAPDLTA